ncbi:transmembrane protein [Cystoisospora suis]|uniref:Transmembrane protein n=1 Tax=Cystoisospora suis TaxID=483139 RepID=A0A2C6L4J0_9APIC|nr:transmembrane protein [Cystoisospora suis]
MGVYQGGIYQSDRSHFALGSLGVEGGGGAGGCEDTQQGVKDAISVPSLLTTPGSVSIDETGHCSHPPNPLSANDETSLSPPPPPSTTRGGGAFPAPGEMCVLPLAEKELYELPPWAVGARNAAAAATARGEMVAGTSGPKRERHWISEGLEKTKKKLGVFFTITRWHYLTLLCLYSVLIGPVYLNWAPLRQLFFDSGVYAWVCDEGETNSADMNYVDPANHTCAQQRLHIGNLFTLCTVADYGMSFFGGLVMDVGGPKMASLCGTLLMILGWVLIGLSSQLFNAFEVGFIIFGLGIDMAFYGTLPVSALFPGHANTVRAVLVAMRSVSYMTPVILQSVAAQFGIGYRGIMFGYGVAAFLPALLITFLVTPWSPWTTPSPASRHHHCSPEKNSPMLAIARQESSSSLYLKNSKKIKDEDDAPGAAAARLPTAGGEDDELGGYTKTHKHYEDPNMPTPQACTPSPTCSATLDVERTDKHPMNFSSGAAWVKTFLKHPGGAEEVDDIEHRRQQAGPLGDGGETARSFDDDKKDQSVKGNMVPAYAESLGSRATSSLTPNFSLANESDGGNGGDASAVTTHGGSIVTVYPIPGYDVDLKTSSQCYDPCSTSVPLEPEQGQPGGGGGGVIGDIKEKLSEMILPHGASGGVPPPPPTVLDTVDKRHRGFFWSRVKSASRNGYAFARDYLFCALYFPILPYFVITLVRAVYFNNASHDLVPHSLHFLHIIIGFVCVFPPIAGFIADRFGVLLCLSLVNATGTFVILGSLLLLALPGMVWLEYIISVFFMLNMSLMTNQIYFYVGATFPQRHLGKLIGFTCSVGGILSLLAAPMFDFSLKASNGFLGMLLLLSILSVINYAILFLLHVVRKRRGARTNFLDGGSPAAILTDVGVVVPS